MFLLLLLSIVDHGDDGRKTWLVMVRGFEVDLSIRFMTILDLLLALMIMNFDTPYNPTCFIKFDTHVIFTACTRYCTVPYGRRVIRDSKNIEL
ncbi:hypothetical protein K449DRAFT_8664 [Hypoxylon sp. EC38]|nr:hypothetical protein K449DRAFT_8664 [Hypoxylon sp. EC38]